MPTTTRHLLTQGRSPLLAIAASATLVSLAACSGGVGAVGTTGQAASAEIKGCDYASGAPSASTLAADGYAFVVRYLSGDPGGWKDISASEAQSLLAVGLKIGLVWETTGTDVSGGYDQGVSDATAAKSEAASVGQPTDRPIYFAIDYDAESGDYPAINAYFQGVASVLGLSRTGVYAGYSPVNELFNEGLITYGWQTYAWSGGEWDSRAQLRQTLDGNILDMDEALASDYGQWPLSGGSSSTGSGSGSGSSATTCTTGTGESGVCINTSTCSAQGGTSTAGYCPGAANIECCTMSEGSGSGSSSGSGSGHSTGGGADCYSMTLGKSMPDNACVQDEANDLWYQCDNGAWVDRWTDPTACNGIYAL